MPFELAGHGRRLGEELPLTVDDVVMDLLPALADIAVKSPYIIYGHSMGTLIAYELAKRVSGMNLPAPLKLCFSGRNPPFFNYSSRECYLLDDDAFIDKISLLGDNIKEIFKSEVLREIYLPQLKSDYQLIGLYDPHAVEKLFKNDILFFASREDPVIQLEQINLWNEYTEAELIIQ